MRDWAHGGGGTAAGQPSQMDMRPALSILCILALSACGQGPSPATLRASVDGAPDAGARPAAATQPAAAQGRAPSAMPAPEALTDSAITERIRTAIAGDPGMAGADVSINIDRGVVVLAGTVKSHEQTGIASSHAQRQDGVVRVDNQLRPALS